MRRFGCRPSRVFREGLGHEQRDRPHVWLLEPKLPFHPDRTLDRYEKPTEISVRLLDFIALWALLDG